MFLTYEATVLLKEGKTLQLSAIIVVLEFLDLFNIRLASISIENLFTIEACIYLFFFVHIFKITNLGVVVGLIFASVGIQKVNLSQVLFFALLYFYDELFWFASFVPFAALLEVDDLMHISIASIVEFH